MKLFLWTTNELESLASGKARQDSEEGKERKKSYVFCMRVILGAIALHNVHM